MRSCKSRWIVTSAFVLVLLVPALIWGGKRTIDTVVRDGSVKMPEVSTIGPEMTPYRLTPLEIQKLEQPVVEPSLPGSGVGPLQPETTIGSTGPYTGMTPAELEKLARSRTTSGQRPRAMEDTKMPVSTIEATYRSPGVEGLTPEERTKLEAYLESRNR
jgi:hypothetical protein